LDLCVGDLERSLSFYGELLVLLGWRPDEKTEIVGECGERVVYLPFRDDPGLGALGLRCATETEPVDRHRIGLHHIAFNADSPETVDVVWDWVRAEVVIHEGAPRGYYSGHYYALFVRDPDNIKIEVVHCPL
jgi:catechol 2,3-dioxygenase-like lactoylglutathione lyase family enzyme